MCCRTYAHTPGQFQVVLESSRLARLTLVDCNWNNICSAMHTVNANGANGRQVVAVKLDQWTFSFIVLYCIVFDESFHIGGLIFDSVA